MRADIISHTATSLTIAPPWDRPLWIHAPTANPACVEVTFLADTANILPFSVTGPADSRTFWVKAQRTVELDSVRPPGGPTYPQGVYGGTPSIPYSVFDWASAFTGPDLSTEGMLSITPKGPVLGSSFSATVTEVTSVPEPSALLLFVAVTAAFLLRCALQSPLGICAGKIRNKAAAGRSRFYFRAMITRSAGVATFCSLPDASRSINRRSTSARIDSAC